MIPNNDYQRSAVEPSATVHPTQTALWAIYNGNNDEGDEKEADHRSCRLQSDKCRSYAALGCTGSKLPVPQLQTSLYTGIGSGLPNSGRWSTVMFTLYNYANLPR